MIRNRRFHEYPGCLTTHDALDSILEENQVRYLRKLGGYVRAVERIPSLLRKVGKIKITIEQVIP